MNINHTIENIEDYENEISNFIDIDSLVEENEKSKIISNTLDNIKSEEKQIFILFYYQSKKIKEISKEMNVSQGKIKQFYIELEKLLKRN